jgi:hypothetical protein
MKEQLMGMQAGVVLANIYTSRVQGQLQAAEERKLNKGKKRLMGDGKAKLFSGNEFYTLCVEDERKKAEEEAAAGQRRVQRESHAAALAAWKTACDAIKDRNRQKKQDFEKALAEWEAERAVAKAERRRPSWVQPRWRRDFQPERLPERPKRQDNEEEEESNGEDIAYADGEDIAYADGEDIAYADGSDQ